GQYSLGTLLARRTATQGFVHARLVQYVRKELDRAPLGKYAVGPDQDGRGRTVATGNRGREWNQGQNQMCDVGFVFSCGSLGVLWAQPDLLRHSSRKWRRARTEYGSACQRETPEVAVEIDCRPSRVSFDTARIPRPASRVSGCRTGNTSRRTRCTPLDGLRFQRSNLRRSTFLLLASRRTSGRYKVGSIGAAAADASGAERWSVGVESKQSLQPTRRLCFSFRETQRPQAARLGSGAEEKDPACVCETRHYGRRLAYLSAHRWDNARGT